MNEDLVERVTSKFNVPYINDVIRVLSLNSRKIDSIDDEFRTLFSNLKELSISDNNIAVLENIPPTVEMLEAIGNRIEQVKKLEQCKQLYHLCLGYNRISTVSFLKKEQFKTHLYCLDLSYNDLLDFDHVISVLKELKNLHILNIEGNCFCMFKNFKSATIDALKQIRFLDGEEIQRNSDGTEAKNIMKEGITISVEIIKIKGVTLPSIEELKVEIELTEKIELIEKDLKSKEKPKSKQSERANTGNKGTRNKADLMKPSYEKK